MSFSIQTNVNSLVAQENLRVNSNFQSQTIQRLTSGYRINASGDDAAGLSVANQFRSDISELSQGVRNANDGISQLQIVDGGLSNISQMLDRMKTLATQSASATFTGDRNTLNAEFSQLVTEINRQAADVGLNNGGTLNKNLSVYIGGGRTSTMAGSSTVSVDLSASAVDSAGLGISGSTIAGGTAGVSFALSGGNRLDNPGVKFAAGGSQTITVNYADSNGNILTKAVQVQGGTSGLTGTDFVSSLNSGLAGTGVSASIDSNGKLQLAGSVAFTATAGAVSGGGNAVTGSGNTVENAGMYAAQSQTWAAGTGTEKMTVTDGTTAVDLSLDATLGTSALAAASLNSQLQAAGVKVTALDDNGKISFQSAGQFTIAETQLATSNGAFTTLGKQTIATPSANATSGSAAVAAISAINAAITKLGTVQGVVGSGQNKLNYAINLAQSQISNFSAAQSRIRDADVAQEAANLTKAQVLQQASLAAMAQANSAPQAVLSLLRG